MWLFPQMVSSNSHGLVPNWMLSIHIWCTHRMKAAVHIETTVKWEVFHFPPFFVLIAHSVINLTVVSHILTLLSWLLKSDRFPYTEPFLHSITKTLCSSNMFQIKLQLYHYKIFSNSSVQWHLGNFLQTIFLRVLIYFYEAC